MGPSSVPPDCIPHNQTWVKHRSFWVEDTSFSTPNAFADGGLKDVFHIKSSEILFQYAWKAFDELRRLAADDRASRSILYGEHGSDHENWALFTTVLRRRSTISQLRPGLPSISPIRGFAREPRMKPSVVSTRRSKFSPKGIQKRFTL
jgi:hypothetical protein